MNRERIIALLEEQLLFSRAQNAQLLEQNNALSEQTRSQALQLAGQSAQLIAQSEHIRLLTGRIEELTASVQSLEQVLASRNVSLEKMKNTKEALGKLVSRKSEKISQATPACRKPEEAEPKNGYSPKERGNNNAKRKEYPDMQIKEHDIFPSIPGFLPGLGKFLKTVDSIRYEYIPPRFIKHINHLHYYLYQGNIIYGDLPAAPFLNSCYDASFMAGMLQLRYIYSMPIERIVKFFAENGFEMNKATAHGLIRKTAQLFDSLEKVLRQAVLEDDYLHMDESYYTVLEKGPKSTTGKSSCKAYIWAALAHHSKLVHFFYEKGSRARTVLTGYINPQYRGAIQTDGLADYKILESEEYPHIIRLACFQHCKRKFLDIKGNKEAMKIVEIINRLYQMEHRIPPGHSPQQVLECKKTQAVPILKELKEKLLEIQSKKSTLPKSALARAVNYALKEYPALYNYILEPEYRLDNNDIERLNRYISLSRKNSLFCGSHKGAKRAALIYSLACSCRLNGINSFEYFKDILNKFVGINPNTDKKYLRELLPDRWKNE